MTGKFNFTLTSRLTPTAELCCRGRLEMRVLESQVPTGYNYDEDVLCGFDDDNIYNLRIPPRETRYLTPKKQVRVLLYAVLTSSAHLSTDLLFKSSCWTSQGFQFIM